MTLNIDTSKAIRTPPEQRALVQAILDAPEGTQETTWIEWKSIADAAEQKWQAELSRQILAFANRDPQSASVLVGGCAYVVVGASPGNLVGTVLHDVATLEDWLSVYVGRAPRAPGWTPYYAPMGKDKVVLVLTVEPPSPGDPIWTFRKDYQALRAGSIFVRRKASSDIARTDDVDMLTRRACGSARRIGGLSLIAQPNARAVAIDNGDAVTRAWADAERAALKPAAPSPPKPQANDYLSERMAAQFAKTAGAFAEPRTAEQFQAEVDKYIKKGSERFPLVLLAGAVEHQFGRVELFLKNETKTNLHQVQVELTFDAKKVVAFFDGEVGHLSMPDRPTAFGKGHPLDRSLSGRISLPYVGSSRVAIRRGQIDNSGSARIKFDPVDLYPEKSEPLEPFNLIVLDPEDAGRVLTGTWTAVAKDVDDTQRGTLAIEVDSNIPSTEELLAEPTDDDMEDDF